MKIYRGPLSKDFEDDSHLLVDSRDLSKNNNPWSKSCKFDFNVSKEGHERHSVVNLVLEEQDILALHKGLLQGIYDKATKYDQTLKEKHTLIKTLESIKLKLSLLKLKSNSDTLDEIVLTINSVLSKKA